MQLALPVSHELGSSSALHFHDGPPVEDYPEKIRGMKGRATGSEGWQASASSPFFSVVADRFQPIDSVAPQGGYGERPTLSTISGGGDQMAGVTSAFSLATSNLSSIATSAASLTSRYGRDSDELVSPVDFKARGTSASPPLLPDSAIIEHERSSPAPSGAADAADRNSAAPEHGRSPERRPVVIQTDIHLDGQVIARAVSQQIVDWMNGPLSGTGGFDPRRSYTPIET